ncbi:MAG: YidC/Oxa1 family membrane protein insertase [Candidatus Pacebacteria bacterium]|nr:YidC/Oxa1 family membrane protein insertase [Candidatus Paceibacterota bacterium]
MSQILIFQPLYNLLAFLSNIFQGELGWAALILAALIRLAIWPWYKKAMADQKKMAQLQPKMQAIQKKYKEDPSKSNQEIVKLLQTEKINLGSSFLFLFVQIGLVLVLFAFFNQAIINDWSPFLYSFTKLPRQINYVFLGLVDLRMPNLALTIVSVFLNLVLVFIQPQAGQPSPRQNQNKAIMVILPFIILFFYKKIPAIIILYWIGFSLVNILQEFSINFKRNPEPVSEGDLKEIKMNKRK